MSKVLNLASDEVIDHCANEECNSEIHFGQSVWRVGIELVCSSSCLVKKLGATKVFAGEEEGVKDGTKANQ
ncbi:hypothetical protein D3C81_667030 [compost metagenome]